ncbi:2-oxoacid:acceptor oxidoreductase family protein [Hominifimenecus sp. rT4P-3]|uniref:2-oxoacid:acceptor oxidoreductase family protein n=1 Tax=Hominifimenecus sp. rT4P-3 TaxID=3242979 RepID=UPI003DA4B2DF
MNCSILIAGFGGQGVLSLGKLICMAADRMGLYATFFPSYGGEQRGGTCNCTVVLSDEEVGTPVVSQADYVIIMNLPSYEKFRGSTVEGGKVIVNVSQVKEALNHKQENEILIEADETAHQLGSKMAANMVVLGSFVELSQILDAAVVDETIQEVMKKKPQLLATNRNAYEAGRKLVAR